MSNGLSEINTQRGAVLIVALIMLLLLTLVGLSSMRSTSLQENMAGNLRENYIAYQAAEAALQMGLRKSEKEFDECYFSEDSNVDVEGEYSGLTSKVTKAPHYKIVKINNLRNCNDTNSDLLGGYLLRIDAFGYGLALGQDNEPVTKTQLRATYEIRCGICKEEAEEEVQP